jgi:hypothetical protein
MHKLYIFLSIPILIIFLSGYAGNAAAESNETSPTSVPEEVGPTSAPEVVSKEPPANCPVTVPQDPPFVPYQK